MNEIMKNVASLIKVKSIITFVVLIVFTVLAIRGSIDAGQVMTVVTTVIAFYFGTQTEKNTTPSTTTPSDKEM